ncbi:hypothetical protein [Rubripirellula tenax]|nr:hypothetical protein [Rubripirellula tenax]
MTSEMQTWDAVQYRVVDVNDSRIDAVVDAVSRTHMNGGVLVGCFTPRLAHEFDGAMSDDLRGEWQPARSMLSHPILRNLDPELQISIDADSLTFARLGGYTLEGEITHLIRSSGAYHDSNVNPIDARAMSRDFVNALSDGPNEHLIAYRTYDDWAPWFCGVAWDVTLLVLDPPVRRWWIICVTDTD